MKKKRIGVLMGGLSKEKEISFKSGRGVSKALRDLGYENIAEIDAGFDLAEKLRSLRIEVVFNVLHGRFGEDGCVQGLLEYLRIPYTGSGVLGSALSMSKVLSKRIFEGENIPTPQYRVFDRRLGDEEICNLIEKSGMDWPMVVKPSSEGSTIGLSVVRNRKELKAGLSLAFEHDAEIIVERFARGVEVTVAILDDDALPVVEIAPKEGIFDYKAKYTKGLTNYYVPARISESLTRKAQAFGIKAFKALKCYSFGRVDMMCEDDKVSVLEVNSIPGFTGTSLVPMAAEKAGINYGKLCERILKKASLKLGTEGE